VVDRRHAIANAVAIESHLESKHRKCCRAIEWSAAVSRPGNWWSVMESIGMMSKPVAVVVVVVVAFVTNKLPGNDPVRPSHSSNDAF